MKKTSNLIKYESQWSRHLLWSLIAGIISGFSTYFIAGHSTWQQWTSLIHVVISIILIVIIVPYLFIHFKRTLVTRRPATLLLGIIAATVFMMLAATGMHITFFGQLEALRWIYDTHVYTATALIFFLFAHMIAHWITMPDSRKKSGEHLFPSFRKPNIQLCGALLAVLLLSTTLATITYNVTPDPYTKNSAVMPYELPYGNHPFMPAQTETDGNTFIDERIIAGSDRCVACHKQIGHEWRSSIHGQAAADKSYVTNINLLIQKKGLAAARYCESCHAPVALLSGQLSKGGKHGGIAGTTAFLEGVSCMSCHGIDKVKNLKGVGSYHFTPPRDYLFASKQGYLLTKLHNLVIQINPEEHKEDMARPILSSPKLCATCHIQFMDKEINHWGWVKMQDQYDSWLKSPFSGQGEQTFSNAETKRCQDCHFTPIQGNDPSANAYGKIISHRSLGGNTAIPWLAGDSEQLDLTRKFLQSGKVRIDIEEPRRTDATQSRRSLNSGSKNLEPPFYLYLGESTKIKTIVTNQLIGHDFPAGATDISEVWIHFRVVDAQNNTVFESGKINAQLEVDPNAHFYRSVPIDKNGNHVWKHDLFNMVGTQYRNTIPAGEADIVKYQFEVPYWAKSPLTINSSVRYRNFNQKYARWALQDEQVELPIIDVAQETITIPLRHKPEIESIVTN